MVLIHWPGFAQASLSPWLEVDHVEFQDLWVTTLKAAALELKGNFNFWFSKDSNQQPMEPATWHLTIHPNPHNVSKSDISCHIFWNVLQPTGTNTDVR